MIKPVDNDRVFANFRLIFLSLYEAGESRELLYVVNCGYFKTSSCGLLHFLYKGFDWEGEQAAYRKKDHVVQM